MYSTSMPPAVRVAPAVSTASAPIDQVAPIRRLLSVTTSW